MNIFLVVMKDPHVDDEYAACATKETAYEKAERFMDSYNKREYAWDETEHEDWLHYHTAGDDDLSVHIEVLEVQP
jgi:hypothetical protein